MLKLFIYDRLPNHADSKLLRLFLSNNEYEGKLFQTVATQPFKSMVEFVNTVAEADYILLAHEYYFVKNEDQYLSQLDAFAKSARKKVIVFDYGDIVDEVKITYSVVLRTAGYRSELRPNEIIIPPFIEDLGEQFGVDLITKKSNLPNIGFAGMVKLPSVVQELKFQIRIFLHRLKIWFLGVNSASLQGLVFRRKVIRLLERSHACTTNFIIRNSFSAHEKTVSKDPAILRREYVDAIKSSDLNLVIRGDGNYSLRFFEVLSLGRVPLFIDTDTPLPLESEVPYDSFMLRVNHTGLTTISKKLEDFWSTITPESYIEMQKNARRVFEIELRPDIFYRKLFERLKTEANV